MERLGQLERPIPVGAFPEYRMGRPGPHRIPVGALPEYGATRRATPHPCWGLTVVGVTRATPQHFWGLALVAARLI